MATGTIAMATTFAISHAGKKDFKKEFDKRFLSDPTHTAITGFGRSSLGAGFNDILQTTGLGGTTSTYQNTSSLNPYRRLMQSPSGQFVTSGFRAAEQVGQGDFGEAGKNVLKMTPIPRTMGVNWALNYMLDL